MKKRKSILYYIEVIGNKLPHPYWLFVGICVLTVAISFFTQSMGLRAVDPSSGRLVEAINLFSGDGRRRFVEIW